MISTKKELARSSSQLKDLYPYVTLVVVIVMMPMVAVVAVPIVV
jgi:hypothetical protein